MDDNARAQNMMEKLERIARAHNPDLDELYNTLEELKRQGALLKQAEQQQLTLRERQITKRVDELIRIQFDDMDWKYQHPGIYDFIRRHLIFRQLWFQQILTDEEATQVHEEVEALLQLPLFD